MTLSLIYAKYLRKEKKRSRDRAVDIVLLSIIFVYNSSQVENLTFSHIKSVYYWFFNQIFILRLNGLEEKRARERESDMDWMSDEKTITRKFCEKNNWLNCLCKSVNNVFLP